MAKNLIIMESPTKAATVEGYLGRSYRVVASKGHVRDLPKSSLGVDVEDNFKPKYINIRGKGDLIKELKKEAKNADKIYIATDPDREGEAIAWHLSVALGIPLDESHRITFNEVTKTAVKEAIKHPRQIDMGLVDAQQARRILDRIVGYKLSPYLWSTVRSGLSAGRVQSVATRVIVDREEEIRAFVPKEYWTIDADFKTPRDDVLSARFYGTADGKLTVESREDAEKILNTVKEKEFRVTECKHSVKSRQPAPPFTTSTLQQEASRKMNFHSGRTMRAAQELYEGIDLGAENGGVQGLITYMRTDSVRISSEFQSVALEYIKDKFGAKYVPDEPRIFKTKATAQDAHEAVRPVDVSLEPSKIRKYLSVDQYRLYKLIWNRFVASQMAAAEISTVSASMECEGYIFRSTGSTIKFPGFLAVYEESTDDGKTDEENGKLLPEINENEILVPQNIDPEQHYTEPPMRYTEASLIKFLEELGIGRPSTYLLIVPTITQREYVVREGKSLKPTPLGEATTKLMKESFPDIVDYKFTASMEDSLDDIEEGSETMLKVLEDFYGNFAKELEKATENATKLELPPEETDIICDKCGAKMIVKSGRYGKFAACPNYPECKNTKPLNKASSESEKSESKKEEKTDYKCEVCGSDMVIRHGRYGNFYACSKYPECKYTRPYGQVIEAKCPKCGSDILTKWGRNKSVFYSCVKYPECDFSSWDKPSVEKCPQCGGMLFEKKGKNQLICKNENCNYKRDFDPEQENDHVQDHENDHKVEVNE